MAIEVRFVKKEKQPKEAKPKKEVSKASILLNAFAQMKELDKAEEKEKAERDLDRQIAAEKAKLDKVISKIASLEAKKPVLPDPEPVEEVKEEEPTEPETAPEEEPKEEAE